MDTVREDYVSFDAGSHTEYYIVEEHEMQQETSKVHVSFAPYQLAAVRETVENALDYCLEQDALAVKDTMSFNSSLIESLYVLGCKAEARGYLKAYKDMVREWIRCSDDKSEREEYRNILEELRGVTFKAEIIN